MITQAFTTSALSKLETGVLNMESSKLMTPLFYDGNFNREGRRMRAVLEKEISDGTQTYRLWRAAGNPNQSYPRAGNDRYILYVEVNGYLAPPWADGV